jgi:type IV fimbrial biogenesis protein FimT
MSQRGISLIELIAVLAIITIMSGMVIPSMTKIYERSEATASINWIITAVNYTRHAAIQFRTTATLCPLAPNKLDCGGKWHGDLIVFSDRNRDGKLNGRDYLLQKISSEKVQGTFKWRSFRNRQYLQITPLGYTNYQNGNFTYCPASQDLKLARQIVINVQGRARVVHTRDEDGVRIDRYGKPLRC